MKLNVDGLGKHYAYYTRVNNCSDTYMMQNMSDNLLCHNEGMNIRKREEIYSCGHRDGS